MSNAESPATRKWSRDSLNAAIDSFGKTALAIRDQRDELLELVKEAHDCLGWGTEGDRDLRARMRAAIAKAEGTSDPEAASSETLGPQGTT